MDIFAHLHPTDPPIVTRGFAWLQPASPRREQIVAEQCDADRATRVRRASWGHSLTDLATSPVDGRIPEEVAR